MELLAENGRTRRPRTGIVALLALLTIATAIAGCGKKKDAETPPDNTAIFQRIAAVQARADQIFAARDTMKSIRGRWSEPGVASTYVARRSAGRIRFLEEAEDRGEYGSSDNRYYCDESGVFFFYEDRGEEREPRGTLPPMSRLVQRTAIFDSSGALAWGRRLVDGAASTLPDSQAVTIRERAAVLLAHAAAMSP